MLNQIIRILQQYGHVYLKGLWGTIWLSLVTVTAATVFGTLVALMKMSHIKLLNFIVNVYVEVTRGTPLLLQLYFFWIFLPKAMPFEMTDTQCVIVALIFNSSAYVAEVIRSGIQAVDSGQTEAALSLGLSRKNTMTRIILPQAVKNILPALGNEFISLVKETSVISVIAVNDLMKMAGYVGSRTWDVIPPYVIAAAIYLTMTLFLTWLMGRFEKMMAKSDRH